MNIFVGFRTSKTLKKLLFFLTALVVLGSALQILFRTRERVAIFDKINMGPMEWFGFLDILLLALFLFPATRRAGFVMMSCYFSAAVSSRLVIKESVVEPVLILVLLFSTMLLSDEAFFTSRAE